MRAYELAERLGMRSSDVLAMLRADGEWVRSHLSTIASPVILRYLPPEAANREIEPSAGDASRNAFEPAQLPAASEALWPTQVRAGRKRRRRPGPRRATMQQPARDDYDDPIANLRYEPQITTRDVADLLNVSPATVRRWVARGYLTPLGRSGPSNVFDTRAALAAFDAISDRRKATGGPRKQRGWIEVAKPIDRIPPKHYDALLSVNEAARLIQVSPATIRSWIHRGHLDPHRSSTQRAVRLRLGDVVTTAHGRQLPRRRR